MENSSKQAVVIALAAISSVILISCPVEIMFRFYGRQNNPGPLSLYIVLFILSGILLFLIVRKQKGWIWRVFE
jgi:RsiW-degrading membrane proteinase PrsW (M82 family)